LNYKIIYDLNDLSNYLKNAKEIAFDFETAPKNDYRHADYAALDAHKADIVGISLSVKPNTGVYIPLKHKQQNNMNLEEVLDFLNKFVFSNKNIIKIAHNLSFEAMFLYKHGIIIKTPVYDTIAASQLTLKSGNEFRSLSDSGLKTLVKKLLKVDLPKYEDVTCGKYFDELDPEDNNTLNYACSDSDYALRLYHIFNDWFDKFMPKHRKVVEQIESPTAVMVGIMKFNGIKADTKLIYEKQLEAENKLDELRNKLNKIAGRNLDIGKNASTNDFKKFLYEDNKLPVIKTTPKFRTAADDEALILLKNWCSVNKPELVEFIDTIQEFRKWSKLKSTYIDGILNFVNNATEAVHTSLFPLGTETGRFSSNKPNMQNCPRKDNDPIGIRNFFIARDGHVFLDFDFSQIELRVGAYYSRDEKMLDVYNKNGDIHAQTTSVIYKIPIDEALDKNIENYKERRGIAKNCNFGILYGLFPKGLQNNLNTKAGLKTTISECEEIINNLNSGYPKISKWQNETKKTAGFRRYSETLSGRRRYLKGINSPEWKIKSYWQRCALNSPIQGTAADILKIAMAKIIDGLSEMQYIRPILTIHDEIVFEVPVDKVSESAEFIKSCMEEVPFEGFDVPIISEGSIGTRFGDLKEIDVSI